MVPPSPYFLTPDQAQAAHFIDGKRFAVPLFLLGREPGANGSPLGEGTFQLRKIHQGTFAVMRTVCPFTPAEQGVVDGWARGMFGGVKNVVEDRLTPDYVMHLVELVRRQDKERESGDAGQLPECADHGKTRHE